MHDVFVEELTARSLQYAALTGSPDEQLKCAITHIDAVMQGVLKEYDREIAPPSAGRSIVSEPRGSTA
jgi:hypothetical protein